MDILMNFGRLDEFIMSLNTVPAQHHNEGFSFFFPAWYAYLLQNPSTSTGVTPTWTFQDISKLLRLRRNFVLGSLGYINREIDSDDLDDSGIGLAQDAAWRWCECCMVPCGRAAEELREAGGIVTPGTGYVLAYYLST